MDDFAVQIGSKMFDFILYIKATSLVADMSMREIGYFTIVASICIALIVFGGLASAVE